MLTFITVMVDIDSPSEDEVYEKLNDAKITVILNDGSIIDCETIDVDARTDRRRYFED